MNNEGNIDLPKTPVPKEPIVLRRFGIKQLPACGSFIGEMVEAVDGDFVKYSEVQRFLKLISDSQWMHQGVQTAITEWLAGRTV